MKYQKIVTAVLCAVTSPAFAITDDPTLETVIVTGSRFEETYADKPLNVSVITREDINKSSARTIPELLSQQAGIFSRDFFGNNAALATVDMRGFGAAAGQNTLILLDGRRITNADLSGVQWSAIPFASIERIEILRGSGAVLYGDGATNGVINIITRSQTQPGSTGQVGFRAGSYGMTEMQANASYFSGKAGMDFTANQLVSDGYRVNNRNEQLNAQVNARWKLDAGELIFKGAIDQQDIRLPGARLVQPSIGTNLVATDPRGTSTPLDYASRDGSQLALEWRQKFYGADVNVGVARRTKNQKSYFDFGGYPNYRDSDLNVNSFTPRIRVPHSLGGDSVLVMGIDVYRWDYDLLTSNAVGNIGQPINKISMAQQNNAVYLQNTTHISSATSLLAGVRNERISIDATDIYNALAPGASFGSAAAPGSFRSSRNAYELGLRHQLDYGVALNGKVGRSFRFANVDEIYETSPTYTNQFQFLRPQTSDNVEVGMEQRFRSGNWRAALFNNNVRNEIHLDPFTTGIGNTNLPPSRRRGFELDGKWQALSRLILNAAYTYTDAKFLSGVLAGDSFTQTNVNIADKKVPLVPVHKLNLGGAWAISEQTLLNSSVTYVSAQFMDNDEANTLGMKIPAYTIADIKLAHKIGPWQLSSSVNNLFDRKYYNYAVSSQFTPGRYNAYPLPGRMLFVGVSYQH
jgi:iron complex outermembrane receptor protein